MIFGYAKMAITLVMIIGVGGAIAYVYKLRADNAVLKANNMVLEQSVESQKKVIEQQKKDFETILETNKKLTTLSNNLQKELNDLDKRFTKQGRDIGKTAIAKDKAIQRIINKASVMALRCVEISSGSPLTEKELNATKKSEINRECPSIANPNYVPY
tara:strand:- start:3040 stop:3513 length:474 start_codon:yes stop_codon:yes gene_type:complete